MSGACSYFDYVQECVWFLQDVLLVSLMFAALWTLAVVRQILKQRSETK